MKRFAMSGAVLVGLSALAIEVHVHRVARAVAGPEMDPGSTATATKPADAETRAARKAARQRRQQQRQQAAAQSQPAGPNAARRAANQAKKAANDAKKRGPDVAADEGDGPDGMRLTGNESYNTQPVVLSRKDGSNRLAWVAYVPASGDFLLTAIERDGKLDDVQHVTKEPADLFRPVLVRSNRLEAGSTHDRQDAGPTTAASTSMLLFTKTIIGKGPEIFFSTLKDEKWTEPIALPEQEPHTLNPEAAALPDGTIAVVYQRYGAKEQAYHIGLRIYKEGRWSSEKDLSAAEKHGSGPIDCWDPVAAYDSKSGKLLTAWVSYYAGDYDLCWATVKDGEVSSPKRVPRAGYDLHPTALSDPEGGVWLAWDSITIPRHGGSGPTFIKHPHPAVTGDRSPAQVFYVAAAKWNDGELTAPGGNARVSGTEENTHHGGTPKLVFDKSGHLYIAYRTLHEPVSGRMLYFWDISTRSFDGGKWGPAARLKESDGPTEEAAVVADGGDAMRVFYQRDYRRTKKGNDGNQVKPQLANARLAAFFDDHHGDYGDPQLRHGDIFVTRISAGSVAKPQAVFDAAKSEPPVEKTFKQFELYKKGEYTVYFGDLHRHSNVSRCSRGAEPDPDDHYRYARDVCRYDFLGLSDHAAHTSDYNWWRIEKLADLYYTPGDFTTLFGVEWNGPEGHKNVMSPVRKLPLMATTGVAPNAMKLWEMLEKSGVPAITIPHTTSLPGQDCDWSKHNAKYQVLVEMFQACRGSFEGVGAPRLFPQATLNGQHVQDGLAKGYRLGVICSSDHGYGSAYACVYAKENTREAIFDALRDRRTFGTTTYGLVIDFNVNGVMMGRDVKRGDGVNATGFVRGADKLDKVQMIKDNKMVKEWKPDGSEFKLDWKDPTPGSGMHYYYLRVIQENDEMGWSSPSWVVD